MRTTVRISDLNPYLNGTMVKDGDLLKILNEGEVREPKDTSFKYAVFQLDVMLPDGRTKIWTLNKTTRNNLAEGWGDDSNGWVGKYVVVNVREELVRGDLKPVMIGKPAKVPPASPIPTKLM